MADPCKVAVALEAPHRHFPHTLCTHAQMYLYLVCLLPLFTQLPLCRSSPLFLFRLLSVCFRLIFRAFFTQFSFKCCLLLCYLSAL